MKITDLPVLHQSIPSPSAPLYFQLAHKFILSKLSPIAVPVANGVHGLYLEEFLEEKAGKEKREERSASPLGTAWCSENKERWKALG